MNSKIINVTWIPALFGVFISWVAIETLQEPTLSDRIKTMTTRLVEDKENGKRDDARKCLWEAFPIVALAKGEKSKEIADALNELAVAADDWESHGVSLPRAQLSWACLDLSWAILPSKDEMIERARSFETRPSLGAGALRILARDSAVLGNLARELNEAHLKPSSPIHNEDVRSFPYYDQLTDVLVSEINKKRCSDPTDTARFERLVYGAIGEEWLSGTTDELLMGLEAFSDPRSRYGFGNPVSVWWARPMLYEASKTEVDAVLGVVERVRTDLVDETLLGGFDENTEKRAVAANHQLREWIVNNLLHENSRDKWRGKK